jgi:hypothetical protein
VAVVWIVLTGILCALSASIVWLLRPQYARGSFKATTWIAFSFGCLAQVIIQVLWATR